MSEIALPVHQTRAEGLLGASDAAAALGLDRYRPPIALWRKLRGLPTNDERPAFVQEAAEWGQALEPIIRGKYALEHNVGIGVPDESVVRDGWLRATPDGYVWALGSYGKIGGPVGIEKPGTFEWNYPTAYGAQGLLQVKTASAYLKDAWADGVPPNYEIQVRVEMAVTGLPWCDVSCLIGGQTRVTYRIERDSKYEEPILRDLRAFWELVQSGKEPSVDGSAAWREYATQGMRPTPVVMEADEETEAIVANWLTAKRSIKALKESESEYKTKLLLRLSAAGATKLRSRHGLIPAYQTGAKAKWKEYAISLGGAAKIPENYKGAKGSWTLKAPGDEDED
jgi:predicted phage-related endonuclease